MQSKSAIAKNNFILMIGLIKMKKCLILLMIIAMMPLNVFAAQDAPKAPTAVLLIAKSSTAASITWNHSANVNGLVAYDVYNGNEKIGSSQSRGGSIFPIYTVTGLEPDSVYVLRVAAVYSDGRQSGKSKPLAVRTMSENETQNIALGKKTEVSSVLTEETYSDSLVDGYYRTIKLQSGKVLRNRWSSGWNDVTEWAMVDVLKPVYPQKIILRHEGATVSANEGINLNTFRIEGSNDKENWTTLDYVEGNISPVTEHNVSDENFYRFYRVYITKYNSATGDSAKMARLSEIEIYNNPDKKLSDEELANVDYLEPPEISYDMPRRYPPRVVNASKANEKITIDGKDSEGVWTKAEERSDFVCLWGASDSTLSFKTAYDDMNLYLFAKIKDKALICDSGKESYWDDDSFEVYLDGNMARSKTYGEDDAQIVFIYGSDNCAVKIGDKSAYYEKPPFNIEPVQVETDDGWCIEIKIPFSLIGVSPVAGKNIGFSLGYSDDLDGGKREAQFRWEGTTSNHISTEAFGTLVLGE